MNTLGRHKNGRTQHTRRNYLERPEVVALLRETIRQSGLSQRAWAEANHVSEQYVSEVLCGKHDPGPAILSLIGLRKHTVFTAVNGGE